MRNVDLREWRVSNQLLAGVFGYIPSLTHDGPQMNSKLLLPPTSLSGLGKLKREQPGLYRELRHCVIRLHHITKSIHALPEVYVVDGALSEMLSVVEHAMQEVRDSTSR